MTDDPVDPVGVTGVKKGHFSKIASPPIHTVYVVWSCDSCIWLTLDPSTNLMVVTKYLGSFGVRRSDTKVKFQTTSNGQTTGVNMLALGKHAKVSTVTPCQTYGSGVKGQKRSNFKQCQMAKLS